MRVVKPIRGVFGSRAGNNERACTDSHRSVFGDGTAEPTRRSPFPKDGRCGNKR